MSIIDTFKKISRQLVPTGRAFRLPGWGEALNTSVATSESQLYMDSVSIMDSLIPDADRFTAEDCTNWERILGLASGPDNTLTERRASIYRKMSNPGAHPAKGHYLTIQNQLQLAGFNVYVYENLFPAYPSGYTNLNPAVVNPAILSQSQHGGVSQHGSQSTYINNVVVNSIYNDVDTGFDVGNLNNTFFIGGSPLGTYANVPASREIEFRQTILQLKQTHKVAYLFINYI